ncbi:MAG TPA: ECF transporter S component [Anaerolineaceae bacterium]|mgnify:FL=1|nr:ECF transporter S component [Anaerolineaceae bacterium]
MAQDRTRKIVVTAVLGAITILLGLTHWGFIPWFGGISLTIMHVPVIIGAILEGPLVGAGIGLIFGLFSMLQAAIAPTGPLDPLFTNPLLAVLPRLFIGPVAWLVWTALKKWPVVGLIASGIVGSLTNTVLVLSVLGLFFGRAPVMTQIFGEELWKPLSGIAVVSGLPEAGVSALITLLVVAAYRQFSVGKRKGANLE